MADMGLFLSLKPSAFVVKDKGDPEVLYSYFKKYVESFKEFLTISKAGGRHSEQHVAPCEGCNTSKALLRVIGGEEMKTLFDHVEKKRRHQEAN